MKCVSLSCKSVYLKYNDYEKYICFSMYAERYDIFVCFGVTSAKYGNAVCGTG